MQMRKPWVRRLRTEDLQIKSLDRKQAKETTVETRYPTADWLSWRVKIGLILIFTLLTCRKIRQQKFISRTPMWPIRIQIKLRKTGALSYAPFFAFLKLCRKNLSGNRDKAKQTPSVNNSRSRSFSLQQTPAKRRTTLLRERTQY